MWDSVITFSTILFIIAQSDSFLIHLDFDMLPCQSRSFQRILPLDTFRLWQRSDIYLSNNDTASGSQIISNKLVEGFNHHSSGECY